MKKPAINGDRLQQSLTDLAKIGAYKDERSGLIGVNRLALTDADALGRRQVVRWFEEAGLEVRVDRIGNVYGRRRGKQKDAAPVLSGSHIDSVPTGGAFDTVGLILISLALICFTGGLSLLRLEGGLVNPWSWTVVVLGVLLVVPFALWELRHDDPLIDVRLFATPAFSAALATNVLGLFMVLGSFLFITQ